MATLANRAAPRLFFGWWQVIVAAVQGFYAVGGATFTAGVFLIPMRDELGWSGSLIFGTLSLRMFAGGIIGSMLGPLAEHRWAPRLILPVGSVLMALSFIMVKWAQTPFDFVLWYGIVGAAGTALASPVVLEAIAVKWFVRRRAAAMTWFQVGPPLGVLAFPVVLTALIAWVGWRDAWLWSGASIFVFMLPLTFLVRSQPEDVGLLPDGDAAPPPARGPAAPANYDTGLTARQALRTQAFWFLTIAAFVGMFGFPGYQSHWVPYFREVGFDAATAAFGVFVFGVFSVSSRFVWGFFASRYQVRLVFTVQMLLSAVGIIIILLVRNEAMLLVWAVAQGLTMGSFFQLQAILVPIYFGRQHIGAIRGMMWIPMNFAAGIAPLALERLHAWRGDYNAAFLMVLAFWLVTALLVYLSRQPRGVASPQNR